MYNIDKHRESEGAGQLELFQEPSQPNFFWRNLPIIIGCIIGVILITPLFI